MPILNGVQFFRSENGAREMAQYIAELVRQGIVYKVTTTLDYWIVETTGGF